MRRLTQLLVVMLLVAAPVQAEEPRESIEAVISDQIAAFGENALGRAFAHASPSIQKKFGTPKRFGQMVASGYPMIWRPAGWEWGNLRAGPRGMVQTVVVEDAQGRLFEADYLMRQIDGVWRIAGVSLRRLPMVGS